MTRAFTEFAVAAAVLIGAILALTWLTGQEQDQ